MIIELGTRLGAVRGTSDGEVSRFLGLRYAEPARRMLPPEPVQPWTGTYDATSMGAQAPQRRGIDTPGGPRAADCLGLFPPEPLSEDCLFLNVYLPTVPAERPRPVMVWVHGGGFWEGSPNIYDGGRLARAADAVVVIIGYRVGYLGVADARQLGGEYARSVNLWLQDQVMALRWVHDTIADFGGDPGNVTVMGQSAGGTSTIALAASAMTRGLLRRAMAFSPAFILPPMDQPEILSSFLEIPAAEVAQWLVAASVEDLLGLANAGATPMPFVDGEVIPADPHVAIASRVEAVPMVSGFAPHEGEYLNHAMQWDGLPESLISEVARGAARLMSPDADRPGDYLERLAAVYPSAGSLAFSDVVWTDLIRASSILAVEATARAGADSWHYTLDVPGELFGDPVGATHGLDVPFTFGMFDDPARADYLWLANDPPNRKLAQRWMSSLGSFVRDGSPGEALGEWPTYNLNDRPTLRIDREGSSVAFDVDAPFRTGVWTRSVG